jgi:hypothetical protein
MMILAAGLALLPAMASAADLSGVWVRDRARSDVVPSSMYWLTRGVDAGGTRGPEGQPVVIEVTHSATTLQVADPARPLRVYALDGQPHTVLADTRVTNAMVTATTQGETVVVSATQPYAGLPGNVTLNVQETWQVSADGKSLTVVTVRDTPAKRLTYTEVYNRR